MTVRLGVHRGHPLEPPAPQELYKRNSQMLPNAPLRWTLSVNRQESEPVTGAGHMPQHHEEPHGKAGKHCAGGRGAGNGFGQSRCRTAAGEQARVRCPRTAGAPGPQAAGSAGPSAPSPGASSGSPLRICNPSLLPPQLIVLVFSSHRSLHVLSFISTRFRCDFKIICEDFKGSQQRRKSK